MKYQILSIAGILLMAGCASLQPASTVSEPENGTQAVASTADDRGASPTDTEVMFNVMAGELLGRKGQVQQAIDHYLDAAMQSNDADIARRATRLAMDSRLWEQALLAADRWALLEPDRLEAIEASITARLQLGDSAGAIRNLDRVFELLQGDVTRAWNTVTVLLARSPSGEQAASMLRDLLQSHGSADDANALFTQSQLAARLGDAALADMLANEAVAIDPNRVDLRQWAGRLAATAGNLDGALIHYTVAHSIEPENEDIALAYAELLQRNESHQRAQEVLAGLPQKPTVLFTRIAYADRAENPELAESLYQNLQAQEDAEEVPFFTAQAAELLDRPTEAVSWYAQVPEGERWLNARLRRAVLLSELEGMDAASRALAELQNDSRSEVVEQGFMVQSQLEQQNGADASALQTLTLGLTKLQNSVPLRYSRALISANLGQVEDAEQDLRLVLEQEPNNPDALNALGYTLTDLTDRHEEALGYIRRAFAMKPNDAAVIDSMGWVMYRLGELEQAQQFLEQALRLSNNAEIAAHLGEVLWQRNQTDEAMRVLRGAVESDPENTTLQATIRRLGIDL